MSSSNLGALGVKSLFGPKGTFPRSGSPPCATIRYFRKLPEKLIRWCFISPSGPIAPSPILRNGRHAKPPNPRRPKMIGPNGPIVVGINILTRDGRSGIRCRKKSRIWGEGWKGASYFRAARTGGGAAPTTSSKQSQCEKNIESYPHPFAAPIPESTQPEVYPANASIPVFPGNTPAKISTPASPPPRLPPAKSPLLCRQFRLSLRSHPFVTRYPWWLG